MPYCACLAVADVLSGKSWAIIRMFELNDGIRPVGFRITTRQRLLASSKVCSNAKGGWDTGNDCHGSILRVRELTML
jgi:hypothetical protein